MISCKFIIDSHEPIVNALKQLNKLHNASMTLFVTNEDGRLIGSVTDGDIRRALIEGISLESEVTKATQSNFQYISDIEDVKKIRDLRARKITLVPILDKKGHLRDIIDLTTFKSKLPIDAVLMAGGKGERLRPLTLTTPKPLLQIGGKPIIDHNIDSLINYGVTNISVTVNYLRDQLISHYSSPKPSGVKIECVSEQQFLGTIGALKLVKEFYNDTILVMNSDLLTDIDFEDFYLHFKEHDAMMSAAAIPYTISIPYGIFDLEGRNIKGVAEKPVYNLYANAGIYLIKKEALKYIPENQVFNATDLIDALTTNGQTIIRYPLSSLWIDIGTPEEYKKAQELIKHLK